MKIIDTHIHPELIIEFEKKINNSFCDNNYIINKGSEKLIEKMFCICTELIELNNLRYISKNYEKYYFSIGIHPCEVKDSFGESLLFEMKENIFDIKSKKEKIIGIGEIGLDFWRSENSIYKKEQIDFFIGQIELAILFDLPLIIHTRNATEETYNILQQYRGRIRGTIHAFQYDKEWAGKFVDLGFVLGIGGIVTYPKNDHIREAIKHVGINHIVLETDSPFLPIQSMRGKINYPHYCYDIGMYVSQLLEMEKEFFFDQVYDNTIKIFIV